MNRRASYLILFGVPILALVGASAINSLFQNALQGRQSRHKQETADDSKAWERDEGARKGNAHEEGLKRSRENQQQLNAAWGGPVQAAWKNPYLSIEQMLGQLGRACAPAGTRVDVRVDRFTEFEVTLDFTHDAPVGQLAQISLCIMRHGRPFVRNLRFTRAGRLLAELETAELDAEGDWAEASQEEIEKHLSMSEPALPKKADTPGTIESSNWISRLQTRIKEVSASANESDLTGDKRRLVDAKSAFNRLLDENTQRLTSLLQKQNEAGDLSNAYRLEDVKAKLALARESQEALVAARKFFLNPDRHYRRMLEQAQLDPLLVSIEMRHFNESQARRRAYLEEVFKVLSERQATANSFLTQMQSLWGTWTSEGNSMRFTSSETQTIYLKATAQLNEATDRFTAALNALARADESAR